MRPFMRLVGALGCGLFIQACAAAPRVIPIPAPSENAARSVNWHNENYQEALAAISFVMVRELNLPPIDGVVTFFSNHQTFENGLAAEFEKSRRREEESTGNRQREGPDGKISRLPRASAPSQRRP